MKVLQFGDKLKEKIVLLLGHFDGIHKGHFSLVEKAKLECERQKAQLAIFTFDDDFSSVVKSEKSIFTLEERIDIYRKFGIEVVLVAKSSADFLSITKSEFLDTINRIYDVCAIVIGDDYTFGKNAEGDATFVKEYCKDSNTQVFVMDKVYIDGKKISSTLIKTYLESGKMQEASMLLGYDYSVLGEVVHGVMIGREMGFPTLNTIFPVSKKMLRRGVYKTYTEIDGQIYSSITNFGTAPTFDRYNFVIETHVLNFDRDVYGKKVRVYFTDFIRGLIKFNSMEDLIVQIKEDVKVYD